MRNQQIIGTIIGRIDLTYRFIYLFIYFDNILL